MKSHPHDIGFELCIPSNRNVAELNASGSCGQPVLLHEKGMQSTGSKVIAEETAVQGTRIFKLFQHAKTIPLLAGLVSQSWKVSPNFRD